MRDVHIRDKIIKDCILLGSPFTVGAYSSRIVSCLHPSPGLRNTVEACAALGPVYTLEPELHLDESTLRNPVLNLDVSTPHRT
jgi:hypothetical protein